MARRGPKVYRIISTESDIKHGVRALSRSCEVMARVLDEAGHPPVRRREPGFEGLARIIVAQRAPSLAVATTLVLSKNPVLCTGD